MRYFDVKIKFTEDVKKNSKETDTIVKTLKRFSNDYCGNESNEYYVCFTFFEENETDRNYNGLNFIFAGNGSTDELQNEIQFLWNLQE